MTTPNVVEQLNNAAYAGLQTFQQLATIFLGASERLTTLNLDVARIAAADGLPLLAADYRSQEWARVSSAGIDHAAAYLRGVGAVYAQSQVEVAELGARQVDEMTDALHAMLDRVAEAVSPATADVVAAMKSALDNANTAYDKLLQSTRDLSATTLAAAGRLKTEAEAANTGRAKKAA
jgi:hypothetical protein